MRYITESDLIREIEDAITQEHIGQAIAYDVAVIGRHVSAEEAKQQLAREVARHLIAEV